LDVADMLEPDSVRWMASEFLQDERLGFVKSPMRVGNPNDSIITKIESYVTDAIGRYLFSCQNTYGTPMMNGSGAAIRAQALIEAGGWDEKTIAEDWSTGMKMILRGWRGKWIDYSVCDEASPPTVESHQKQKSRWANGSAELSRLYLREW